MIKKNVVKAKSTNKKVAHCPQCGPGRNADIRAQYKQVSDADDGAIEYRVLQCRGCELVYFERHIPFAPVVPEPGDLPLEESDHTDYWPAAYARKRPFWVMDFIFGSNLNNVLVQIYTALDHELHILAAIGIRTALDSATALLRIDQALPFAVKLEQLLENGKIGPDEKRQLELLTNAGNAAVHRQWFPEPEQLNAMMDIIESFIYRALVLPAFTSKLKKGIPKHQRKKKKRRSSEVKGGPN